jgi:hypothetical protein
MSVSSGSGVSLKTIADAQRTVEIVDMAFDGVDGDPLAHDELIFSVW